MDASSIMLRQSEKNRSIHNLDKEWMINEGLKRFFGLIVNFPNLTYNLIESVFDEIVATLPNFSNPGNLARFIQYFRSQWIE